METLAIDQNYECGQTIKRLREMSGNNLIAVSAYTGISVSYLSEIENGKKNIDIKFIQKFMLFFNKNMKVSDFFILHEYLKGLTGIDFIKSILYDLKSKYWCDKRQFM